MELLTSDTLSRALTLVARGQHETAHYFLNPPIPQNTGQIDGARNERHSPVRNLVSVMKLGPSGSPIQLDSRRDRERSPGSDTGLVIVHASGVDLTTMSSLDAEIEASLEWINRPAVLSRDSRKAVLQAIGVISSQRGYTFRTASEQLWAKRIGGIRRLIERSCEWREVEGQGVSNDVVVEES